MDAVIIRRRRNRSMIPAAIPRIAETSDHQKPGTLPTQKVVIQPAIPLMRKSQPTRILTQPVAGSTGLRQEVDIRYIVTSLKGSAG